MAETAIGGRTVTHPPIPTASRSPSASLSQSITAPQADTTATIPRPKPRTAENARIQNNGESVANIERAEKSGATKAKFEDILNVSNVTDCQNISIDLDSFSDDINVNGSLCKPESVQFFKKLGASDYIIKTLTDGHHSTFTNDVPSYERRNNKSFYEHEEFAVNDILELIKKGKVEVLNSKPHIVNPLSVAVQQNKLQ